MVRHNARQTSPKMVCGFCKKPISRSTRLVKYGPGKVYSKRIQILVHAPSVS